MTIPDDHDLWTARLAAVAAGGLDGQGLGMGPGGEKVDVWAFVGLGA
jgi:hypothetical protein